MTPIYFLYCHHVTFLCGDACKLTKALWCRVYQTAVPCTLLKHELREEDHTKLIPHPLSTSFFVFLQKVSPVFGILNKCSTINTLKEDTQRSCLLQWVSAVCLVWLEQSIQLAITLLFNTVESMTSI